MSDEQPKPEFPPLRADQIDEWVRDTFRNYMKPSLKPVYRSILDNFPNPAPAEFIQRKSQ